MDVTFETIGLEVPSEKAFNYLAERAGDQGEPTQRTSPWALTEYDEEGEAVVHGYCDGTDTEVLFELQNLTEVGPDGFRAQELHVGLCGLAYRARVCRRKADALWRPLEKC